MPARSGQGTIMEMHQVRYFLAVARVLNFTRAADACNVTQPSLTRAFKQLEAELGQLRGRALAAKQIAAEFSLKLLDRPRQRRLGDIARVGSAGEVEHARDGEGGANLMH